MIRRNGALGLLLLAAVVARAGTRLEAQEVGVYGDLYDFCDFAVWKFSWTADRQPTPQQIATWNDRLHTTRAAGKQNLVLLYTFDRVKHSRPVDEYLHNTDQALEALDREAIDVLCLSEENVTWNNGLAVLNTLSDHIRETYHLPVYQWLTMPDVPHPKLHADGWIIDPYGFDKARFRRYLTKYLVTGKPVIDCITASPFKGAVWDQTARDQVEVCREFGVPMFFFCVDRKYGSPAIWLTSTDADIAQCRDWLMDVVSDLHAQPRPVLPRESANFSTGRPIEICGGQDLSLTFEEGFAGSGLVDDATIRGLWGLAWDGEAEKLGVRPAAAKLPQVLLQWSFTSPFGLKDLSAELEGEQTADTQTRLAVSLNGHSWSTSTAAEAAGPMALKVPVEQPDEAPREVWLRVTVAGGEATVSAVRLRGVTIPPERREVALVPTDDAKLGYEETFDSPRFYHLSEVTGGETLTWSRGMIATHGVKGRGNHVAVRWRLVAEQPLKSLTVVATGQANGRNLGGRNRAALELEDGTLLAEADTGGQEGNSAGWVTDPLTLEADTLPAGTTVVYLTLEMANTSGVETNRSNLFRGFRVEAVRGG